MMVLFGLSVVVFWMLGGQFGSAWRKYGIMSALIALVIWRSLHGEVWWNKLPLLLICPVLFVGYGEHSWLMRLLAKISTPLRDDDEVRLAQALLLGLPLVITSPLPGILGTALLTIAFMVHAGGIRIGSKDFLWEDVFRSSALAAGIVMVTI